MRDIHKKVIFSLIPLLLLLVVGELAVRIKFFVDTKDVYYLIVPFAQKNHGAENILMPTNEGSSKKYAECDSAFSEFTVNSNGFRGKELNYLKNKNCFRIVVVGGSTAYSYYNPDKYTWAHLLEDKLNDLSNENIYFEVVNLGQSGINSENILETLNTFGYKLKPDLVLYYEAINDSFEKNFHILFNKKMILVSNTILGRINNILYYNSMLYTYLVEKSVFSYYSKIINKDRYQIDQNRIKKVVKNFLTIADSCKANSIKFVYIKQVINYPLDDGVVKYTDNRLSVGGADISEANMQVDSIIKNNINFSSEEYPAFRQRFIVFMLSNLSINNGISVIDPLPAFEKARDNGVKLFLDICHKTCYGDILLSECIYRGLIEQELIPVQ